MKETGIIRLVHVCVQILQHTDNDIFMEIKHCVHNMTKEDNIIFSYCIRNNLNFVFLQSAFVVKKLMLSMH